MQHVIERDGEYLPKIDGLIYNQIEKPEIEYKNIKNEYINTDGYKQLERLLKKELEQYKKFSNQLKKSEQN